MAWTRLVAAEVGEGGRVHCVFCQESPLDLPGGDYGVEDAQRGCGDAAALG